MTISNSILEVSLDAASGHFRLTARPSGRTFVRDGAFPGGGGTARLETVPDLAFGAAKTLILTHPDGSADRIQLLPDLPFALVSSRLANRGTEPTVTRSVQPLTATLDLGQPARNLQTLGTAGLKPPGRNPGSYVWLAVVEPKSRHGVVAAWLTHDRGSGVVFNKVENDQVQLTAQLDYGRLRIAPGATAELEQLAIGEFDDARLGLEAFADAVVKRYQIRLRPQPVGYCTWYSRPYGGASDETHLAELAAFAAKNLKPFGFSVVQIDDGWQDGISKNGPRRNFFTHRPDGPYPSGMKAIADKIRADGLVAGIWFMPFAGTYYDPFFQAHPDWFVKRASDGQPYETSWGGACLDPTHPEVRSYLRSNAERFARDWGFQYFKMDALWTGTATPQQYVNEGYKDDKMGDAVPHDPDVTNIEAFRSGLKLVRAAAGPDVFFLGCCTPQNMRSYGGAFGLVDAMRIGPDNGADWNGLKRGPTFGSRHYFLHGRVWYNDPDPVYVRSSHPARTRPLGLLVGRPDGPAQPEHRLAPRPARRASRSSQANHAAARTLAASGGPFRGTDSAHLAPDRHTPRPAPGRDRPVQLGRSRDHDRRASEPYRCARRHGLRCL